MIKSIQDIPVVRIFVGSSISWHRLLLSINSSSADPSGSSTSPGHHCLDLIVWISLLGNGYGGCLVTS